MIWLYWRRWRPVIAVTGAVLGALAALVVVADNLAGSSPGTAEPSAATRGPGGAQSQIQPQIRPETVVPSGNAQVRRGLLLMSAAAAACQQVSYRGVQIVAWSSPRGSTSYLIDVWHQPGRPELAESERDAVPSAISGPATDETGAAVGVLTLSPATLALLRSNYIIEYAGTGSSSDRAAQIVAVRRRDGTLAAQYWLDRHTGLPLRREMYDESGRRVSEGAFIDLEVGSSNIGSVPPAEGQAWEAYVPPASSGGLGSPPYAATVMALRADGWPVPRALAGNMTLASVTRTATRSGPVLDASYSDGLSVVSVFIQRGQLSGRLPGWHRSRVHGMPVYTTPSSDVDEQGLAWSAGGFVYTVIADAPPDSINQIVVQLPHERPAGFWQRVLHGIKRVGSWFDPFG
jgi:negative regulator of sigma E activity